jgi:hypothetical protein
MRGGAGKVEGRREVRFQCCPEGLELRATCQGLDPGQPEARSFAAGMIHHLGTLLSEDLFEKRVVCDLNAAQQYWRMWFFRSAP